MIASRLEIAEPLIIDGVDVLAGLMPFLAVAAFILVWLRSVSASVDPLLLADLVRFVTTATVGFGLLVVVSNGMALRGLDDSDERGKLLLQTLLIVPLMFTLGRYVLIAALSEAMLLAARAMLTRDEHVAPGDDLHRLRRAGFLAGWWFKIRRPAVDWDALLQQLCPTLALEHR